MTDNATIRAWAAEQGYHCPARGRIPAAVRILYAHAHGVDADHALEEQPDSADEERGVTVAATLPSAREWEDELAQHLANAVHAAYTAGYEACRADIAAQLGLAP